MHHAPLICTNQIGHLSLTFGGTHGYPSDFSHPLLRRGTGTLMITLLVSPINAFRHRAMQPGGGLFGWDFTGYRQTVGVPPEWWCAPNIRAVAKQNDVYHDKVGLRDVAAFTAQIARPTFASHDQPN